MIVTNHQYPALIANQLIAINMAVNTQVPGISENPIAMTTVVELLRCSSTPGFGEY